MPDAIRKLYYKTAETGVYDTIVSDPNFTFTVNGFSKTYDYHNQYLIPATLNIQLTKITDLLPVEPRDLFKVNLKVLVEILHKDKVVTGWINNVPVPIGFVIGRGYRFRYIPLHKNIPTSYLAKFRDDVKIRITVLETDPNLKGCEGTLIIKPQTRW